MNVHNVAQRSAEWTALRLGRLTASRADDMLGKTKAGVYTTGRRNLRIQLVLERITGRSKENPYKSSAMQDGIDREGDATGAYEALTGNLLSPVGFVTHDTLMAGGSPDGVIGEWEGIVEIKSPIPATHLDYLRTGVVPTDYARQVLHLLWLTGAQYCDWFSYQPEFPDSKQIKLVRIVRNEQAITEYYAEVRKFLAEVDAEYAEVCALEVA